MCDKKDLCRNTYWFVFCKGELMLKINNDGNLRNNQVPFGADPPLKYGVDELSVQELPDIDGHLCRAYSILEKPDLSGFCFVGLRESYKLLPRHIYDMAAKASELLYWDSNTRFCGCCGAPTVRNTVISKVCTSCGKEIWPQVSPAIIVRIRRVQGGREWILLVHARNFKRNFYGLVAGFLETGETLEQCVEREVMEETSLKIKNIKYFGSQPWPYPCGVMIGFTADYDGGELHLQDEELSSGGWFTLQNLPEIPDKISIARRLIDDWIENQ